MRISLPASVLAVIACLLSAMTVQLTAAPLLGNASAATSSAVTWNSGVFLGNGANTAEITKFTSYRGADVSYAEVYTPRDTWTNMSADLWQVKQYGSFAGKLAIGLPLTIGATTLAAVASGNADKYFRTFAKNLVALNRGDSDLRLGWEFNGNWYPWSALNPTTFLAAFRHISSVLQAALPSATIDWNGNWGGSQAKHNPFTELYPGNSYVDVISLDAYDGGWVAANTDAKFENWKNHAFSLQAWYDFAVNHGKKFALAEWGLVRDGEKDNPVFIKGVFNFMATHASHIAYEAYFNSTGSSLYNPNEYPDSSSTYRSLYSRTVTSSASPTMTANAQSGSWNTTHRIGVTGLPGSATGAVTFTTNSGSLQVCSARVSGGTASCFGGASYRPGSHSIRATYGGDSTFATTTSSTALTVWKRTPRMSATPSNPLIASGQGTTLSVRNLPGAAVGTVSFSVGSMHLCSGTAVGGAAQCPTAASLRPGAYHVAARWPGNAYYTAIVATTTFTVSS